MSVSQSKYLIDSNIFVEASRRYYPFDFAKTFWDGLIRYAAEGKIISIDKVYNELKQGNDLLKDWAINEFHNHFDSSQTEGVLKNYIALVQHCQNHLQYSQIAKDRFMEEHNADTWILAYDKFHDCIIVTHELPDFNIKKNIPIPNMCRSFNIAYCDTFQMLRQLGFSF